MSFEVVPARETSPMKLRVKNTFLEPEDEESAGSKSRRRASAGPVLGGHYNPLVDEAVETDVGSCSGSGTESTPSAWDRGFSYSAPDLDVVEECDGLTPQSSTTVAEIAKMAALRAQMAAHAHAEAMWGNEDVYNNMYGGSPYHGHGYGHGWPSPYFGAGHLPEFPPVDGEGQSEWGTGWPDHAAHAPMQPGFQRPQGKTTERSKQWSASKASTQTTDADQTTVMLRNLPNDYTRDMLMALLESQGFSGCFDFVYLPFDFKKCAGLGYAFMNMINNKEAVRAMTDLPGFKDWKLKSNKVLQVTWSTPLQGLSANIERYRNSPVMHPDVPEQFKPLLLKDGNPVPFPPPTKALQAPVNPNM